MEDDEPVDLDFESMHKELSSKKQGHNEQLGAIFLSANSLELSINGMVDSQIKKIKAKNIESLTKSPWVPITTKLRLLRFADIIDDNLYGIIEALFKIRNQFAHKILITTKSERKSLCESLKDVKINNDFVDNLPNDAVKFQLISSYCFTRLLEISEKLDPSSVLHLEAVGDFEIIDDS
ncbi:MAG: hypothetical protein QXG97_05445 [Nitrososphaerota archaeon]